jgi:hypothetical protein
MGYIVLRQPVRNLPEMPFSRRVLLCLAMRDTLFGDPS